MPKILVVGAKPGSLGEIIGGVLRMAGRGAEVVTAGISNESHLLDIKRNNKELRNALASVEPDHIVVTAGINRPLSEYEYQGIPQTKDWWMDHMETNCVGPMRLLDAWWEIRKGRSFRSYGHFVAISSNSAHIARTGSGAYCASKAALSMALRVRARELARSSNRIIAYGYEPGLLAGTPMTMEVRERYVVAEDQSNEDVPMHRMPGVPGAGIPPENIAFMVATNLIYGGSELNGCLIRVDGGEQ